MKAAPNFSGRRRRRWAGAAAAGAAGALVAACGGTAGTGPLPTTQTVRVLAASSLTDTFTKLARQYEAADPGVSVVLSFGSSTTLALQLTQGAPGDVLATAGAAAMDSARADLGTVSTFATNVLEVATPPDNPGHLTVWTDIARSGVQAAVCVSTAPCGVATAKLLTRNHLTLTGASQEPDVRSVLTRVKLGSADAGIVYITDVQAAGSAVSGLTIPAARNVSTTYEIGAVKDAGGPSAGFVAYVLSPAGQSVLTAAGFGSAPTP